ncbi:MAG: class I SAM-dependent methyltransferase [Nanoarchaeota archaeon]|nr:class I SAM-dependent methyltransferase [Nanoarchaeota archaeon]
MTFSESWETIYEQGMQLSVFPFSDLVSLVFRNKIKKDSKIKVLELGCGAGANISLFKELGYEYYGIEGSPTIVEEIHKKYPELSNNIIVGDFTKDLIFNFKFDYIIDRSSLTHNDTNSIIKTLMNCYNTLETNGLYIGVDWFSTNYPDFRSGNFVDDNTRSGFEDGQFKGVGRVHFSDESHLKYLFKETKFKIKSLEYKEIKYLIPKPNMKAFWNFVLIKNE